MLAFDVLAFDLMCLLMIFLDVFSMLSVAFPCYEKELILRTCTVKKFTERSTYFVINHFLYLPFWLCFNSISYSFDEQNQNMTPV